MEELEKEILLRSLLTLIWGFLAGWASFISYRSFKLRNLKLKNVRELINFVSKPPGNISTATFNVPIYYKHKDKYYTVDDFINSVSTFVKGVNHFNKTSSIFNSIGFLIAALASIISVILIWVKF